MDDVRGDSHAQQLAPGDDAMLTVRKRRDDGLNARPLGLTAYIPVKSSGLGHGVMLAAQSARMVRRALRVSL
jgi:hypothetical protein